MQTFSLELGSTLALTLYTQSLLVHQTDPAPRPQYPLTLTRGLSLTQTTSL